MHDLRTFMHSDLHQAERRSAILRILRDERVRGQRELAQLLESAGHRVTQSSISRDLRDLGVIKASGRYLPPTDEPANTQRKFAALAAFVRSVAAAGPSLTVLKTTIGAAQSVALAIDKSDWPEVVGTISGDDTIFIATADGRAQSEVVSRLRAVFRL
jgi:transcriptional regulator of arginine metabolism